MMGSFLLLGCSAENLTSLSQPGVESKQGYSVNTPLEVLAADPRANAILQRDVPGVMNNPKFLIFDDMSLAQIAIMSNGKMHKSKLREVQADLDKLSADEAAEKAAATPASLQPQTK